MPSADYYLKQAEIASRMALTEPDPEKARAMHIMALDFFDKAHLASKEDMGPAAEEPLPPVIERQ